MRRQLSFVAMIISCLELKNEGVVEENDEMDKVGSWSGEQDVELGLLSHCPD